MFFCEPIVLLIGVGKEIETEKWTKQKLFLQEIDGKYLSILKFQKYLKKFRNITAIRIYPG